MAGKKRNATPAYRRIFETLAERSRVETELNVSESGIMDEFTVSRDTARKALNMLEREGFARRIRGRGTVVSPQNTGRITRIHILANENFFRSTTPVPLRSKFAGIMDGVLAAQGAAERSIEIVLVRNEDTLVQKMAKITSAPGGVLIFSHSGMEDIISALEREQVPHVIHAPMNAAMNSVATDVYASVKKAVDLLLRSRERILFISPDHRSPWFAPMTDAFRDAHKTRSRSVNETAIVDCDYSAGIPEQVQNVLAAKKYDALFVAEAELARAVIGFLPSLSVIVPRDAAFIAYEDHPDFAAMRPAVSAIRVPLAAVGNTLITELSAMIRFGYRSDIRITLPEELLIRDTL